MIARLFKFTMLRTVADYEHYMPLNTPTAYPVNLIEVVDGLENSFWYF